MDWKDISSYSRGEERVPKTIEATLGQLRLVVTRRHGCDGWYADLSSLWGYRRLIAADLEAAKIEAATMARVELTDALTTLSK